MRKAGGSSRSRLSRGDRLWALAMGGPGLLVLVLFVAAPLVLGLGWSFTNKRLISPLPTRWVGLSNYADLVGVRSIVLEPEAGSAQAAPTYPEVRALVKARPELEGYQEWFRVEGRDSRRVWLAKDPSFLTALLNTLRFVLVIVPCQGGLALVLALLVNQKLKGRNFFRTVYFAPVVTSMAVVSVVWVFLLNPDQGIVNRLLGLVLGPDQAGPRWLTDRRAAPYAIYLVSIWQSAGFQMLIFLAGLQGIPEQLYESASLDGAGPWTRFSRITFPMLKNTTIFVVISTTILAFRVFTQVDVMTKGGPQESTSSLIFYVVQRGFREQRIGYASAVTLLFFLIVLAVSGTQKLLLKSESEMDS